MLVRLLIIFSLAVQPLFAYGASGCRSSSPQSAELVEHSCCCGDLCPNTRGRADEPSICGCGDDEAPPSSPGGNPTKLRPTIDLCTGGHPVSIANTCAVGRAAALTARPHLFNRSLNCVLCTWQT